MFQGIGERGFALRTKERVHPGGRTEAYAWITVRSDGDLVEVVTIGGTMDGRVYLHNPTEYAHTVEVADGLPNETLEGARVGMLRKYVIPRGYTSPSGSQYDSEMVQYFQVTWIEPK